jgi:hypothetical protein
MFSILLLTVSFVQISYQRSAFKHLISVFVPKGMCIINFKLPSKIDFVCGEDEDLFIIACFPEVQRIKDITPL